MHPTRLTHPLLIALASSSLIAGVQPDNTGAPDAEGKATGSIAPDTSSQEAERISGARPASLSISPYAFASFHDDVDLDSDIGDFGFSSFRTGINLSKGLGEKGLLTANLGFAYLDYDISASADSVANDAADIGQGLDDVYTYELGANYIHRADDKWSYSIGAGIVSAGEDGADFDDTLDFLGIAGFRYQYNKDFSLGLGVIVKTRLEDDVLVIPVPQIKLRFSDRWVLESKRAGLEMRYEASDSLAYGVGAEYISTTFRLSDTHAAIVSEGIANHTRVPVSIFADYAPNDQIQIVARVGASLGGKIEFLDNDGNDVTDEDIDPAVFGSINVSFRF